MSTTLLIVLGIAYYLLSMFFIYLNEDIEERVSFFKFVLVTIIIGPFVSLWGILRYPKSFVKTLRNAKKLRRHFRSAGYNSIILVIGLTLFSGTLLSQKSYEVMELEITKYAETVENYWKPGHEVKYNKEKGIISVHYVEIDKYKVYVPDLKESKTWKDGTKTITEYYSGKDLAGGKYSARVIMDDTNDVYLFSFFSEAGDDKAWHYWCRKTK